MRSFNRWLVGIIATLVIVAVTAGAFLGEARDRDRFFLALTGAAVGAVVAAAIQRRQQRSMRRTSLLTGIFLGAVAFAPFEPLAARDAGEAVGYGAGQGAILAAAAAGLWFALQPREMTRRRPPRDGAPEPAPTGARLSAERAGILQWLFAAIAAAVLLVAGAISFRTVAASNNGRWVHRGNAGAFDTRTATICDRAARTAYCYNYRTGVYGFIEEEGADDGGAPSLYDRFRRERAPAPATMDTGMTMDTMPAP